jgi:hypothetical protein
MTNILPAGRVFLEDALLLTINSDSIPACDIPEGMDRVDTAPRRISLVSRRALRPIRHLFDDEALALLNPPAPVFGKPRIITRKGNDDREEMAVLACRVENHAEIHDFVQKLFSDMGLKNYEKRFVYHLTVANNAGGNPRGSIAYLNPSDFEGPAPSTDRVFVRRALSEAVAQGDAYVALVEAPTPKRPKSSL